MHKPPVVGSLSEFIKAVEKIQKEWSDQDEEGYVYPWFRGHSNNTHRLLPGLYRNEKVKEDEKNLKDEKDIEEKVLENEYTFRWDFQLKAHPFLADSAFGVPGNDWEWYFLMQHYGLPTRLLDWTEGSLIALHFALFFKTDEDQTDPCVWVLNPWELSGLSEKDRFIFDFTDEPLRPYLSKLWSYDDLPQYPIGVQPVYKSKRIVVQKGMFTIHGSDQIALEDIEELKPWLKRIDIKYEQTDIIKAELQMAGVTQSSLFPELSGLAQELKEYWKQA